MAIIGNLTIRRLRSKGGSFARLADMLADPIVDRMLADSGYVASDLRACVEEAIRFATSKPAEARQRLSLVFAALSISGHVPAREAMEGM